MTMTKEAELSKAELVELIKRILKTDHDMDFLLKLELKELEILVVFIRGRLEEEAKQGR